MADSFDRTRPLVVTRGGQLNGHNLGRLESVTVVDEPSDRRGQITEDIAARLHARGQLAYADEIVATPVEDARTGVSKLVEVDDLGGGGWFLLRAPWRPEGSKVQGAEAAEKERQALVEEGLVAIDRRRPPEEPGFTISEVGSNGWFLVSGRGLAEPIKVRGEAAALAKRDELARGASEPPPPPPRPGVNTPEFKAGDVVLVGADGEDLAGQRATIDSIEDGQAKVVGFVGEGDERVAKSATVPLASLTAAEPEA